MNPDLTDIAEAAEAFEHLAFTHKVKPRLKTALDVGKLIADRTATFEVEDLPPAETELSLDDDEEVAGLDMESYTSKYFSKRTQDAISKKPATIEALAKTDFISTSFAELKKTMKSIDEKNLVQKEVFRTGTGKLVPENCKIFVNYVIVSEGADEPFDSTLLRRAPAVVDLRNPDVLPGLYLGIRSMEVDEVSKFIIDSSLAFGALGCAPRIPPDADILCIVEILQIIDEQMLESPLFMTAEQRAKLPFEKILETADQLRSTGNGYYTSQNFWTAVKRYKKAANVLEDYPLISEKNESDRNELLHTLYSNMAQCYLKLNKPAQACIACKLGLKLCKGTEKVKLLYRFARAKLMFKDCDAALGLCEDGLKLKPTSGDLLELKREAIELKKKQDNISKMLCKDMFKGH